MSSDSKRKQQKKSSNAGATIAQLADRHEYYEKAVQCVEAEIDIVEVRAVGRFGRLFISGSEESVKTAIKAASSAIDAVDGKAE